MQSFLLSFYGCLVENDQPLLNDQPRGNGYLPLKGGWPIYRGKRIKKPLAGLYYWLPYRAGRFIYRWPLNRGSNVLTVFHYITYIHFLSRTLVETPDITCARRMERKPFDLLYTDYFGANDLEDGLGALLSQYRYRTLHGMAQK